MRLLKEYSRNEILEEVRERAVAKGIDYDKVFPALNSVFQDTRSTLTHTDLKDIRIFNLGVFKPNVYRLIYNLKKIQKDVEAGRICKERYSDTREVYLKAIYDRKDTLRQDQIDRVVNILKSFSLSSVSREVFKKDRDFFKFKGEVRLYAFTQLARERYGKKYTESKGEPQEYYRLFTGEYEVLDL